MTNLLEITSKEINRLNDIQLHELLKKLLFLESEINEIDEKKIHVSLTLKQKDGGEDGRITWEHPSKQKTDFLPNKDVFFQCKQRTNPTGFSASDCKNELVNKEKDTKINVIAYSVKERIHDFFSSGGTYILFCNFSCNAVMMEDRIEGFREGLRLAKAPYAENCDIQIYDGEKIADWTNKFSAAVVYVCKCTGRVIPLGATTWNNWANYSKNSNTFFPDDNINNKIIAIREHFCDKQKVARIVGHSGLGKTRLALEAFRPPNEFQENIGQYRLSEKIIYIDIRNEPDIVPIVKHWRENGLSGILIVDECDCKTHRRLSEEIKHSQSNLSLLSIDYSDDCGIKEDPVFKLEPVNNSVIEKIISETFSELPKIDRTRIVEIAQGYPQMAVLIAQDRSFGAENVGTISDKEIIDHLIGGRDGPTESVRKVITACSLFTSFRVKGEEPTDIDFIAEKICNLDPKNFSRIMKEIKDQRGILEERGRLFRVTPKPLAITLATDWWKYCSLQEAEELLLGTEIPKELVDPLCDQFRYLNLEPDIEELSKELCKERRPFVQAKILNSQRGSRFFRSITEVNPSAAADALFRCFGDADKASLKQVGPGRRNLVWALENLCFWEGTFSKAANILLKFAVSETEPELGNNTTGQFYQLFHTFLSGTQAPPNMRLAVIDEGLSTNDPEFQTICITALGHALQTSQFYRMGGVETQGSRYSHKDWEPKTRKEVFDYWDGSLIRLKKYALKDDPVGVLARSQIEQSINGMLWYGRLDILEDVIFSICKVQGYFWPEVLYTIKRFVIHHSKDIPPEGIDRLNSWIQKLGPKSATEIAYVTVIQPEKFRTFDGKNFIEESSKNVEEFANGLISKPDDLLAVIELLSKTPSTYGHLFGYTLGKSIEDKITFINTLIDILGSAPTEKMDESVLGGFLFAIRDNNSDIVNDCLEKISNDIKLKHLLLNLTARSKPEKRDLSRLINALKEGTIQINDFSILQYGGVLEHLNSFIVTEFLSDLLYISENSCPTVFEIVYMYTFNDDQKMRACIPFLKHILIEQKCFSNILKNAGPNQHIPYSMNDVSTKLLQQEKPDHELASQITEEIIEICLVAPNKFMISHDFGDVIRILLSPKYIDTTWPILGQAIISKDYIVSFCLKDIIGGEVCCGKWNPCLLESISLSHISKWCEENRDKAPYFLSEAILPIIDVENKKIWSPLARYLLDNYGDDNEVLSGLNHKMHQYSWMGSLIPFYETWLNGYNDLLHHENLNVRRWAEKNIEYAKTMIHDAENEEEERELYCG